MVCRNFILPEFCKPCLFLSSFIFAQLILPYLFDRPSKVFPCASQMSWKPGEKEFIENIGCQMQGPLKFPNPFFLQGVFYTLSPQHGEPFSNVSGDTVIVRSNPAEKAIEEGGPSQRAALEFRHLVVGKGVFQLEDQAPVRRMLYPR